MAFKIFISYSGANPFPAARIYADLKRLGAEVFLDSSEIEPGEDFEEIILDNLADCDELWVLVMPTVTNLKTDEIVKGSMDRAYVWLETGVAWRRGIRIVPLLLFGSIEWIEGDEAIPHLIKGKKAVDLCNEAQYQQLLSSIAEKVGYQKRNDRIPFALPAPINIICEENSTCTKALLHEISEDGRGCFIAGKVPWDINQTIQCSFKAEVIHKGYDVPGAGLKIVG